MKFGKVDYVLDICHKNKFGDDQSSGSFWVNMWNIRCLLLYFSPTNLLNLEATPPTNFHTRNAECLKRHGSTYRCAFCSKNRNFSNHGPPGPKTAKIWLLWDNFRSISPLTLAVSEVNTKHPLFFIGAPWDGEGVIVNSQIKVVDSKYVFYPLHIGHVIWGMRSRLFGL